MAKKQTKKKEEKPASEPKPSVQKKPRIEEIDDQIAKLEKEKAKEHLKKETERFKLDCMDCGTALGVNPQDHLMIGNVGREYVCPKCERINIVVSEYQSPPEYGEGEVNQSLKSFVWLERPVYVLNDEQVKKLLNLRVEEIKAQNSKYSEVDQLILRAIGMLMEK